ncbi:thioredoxin (plasmid) [Halobacterium hubeiense]|uniref:Thioredoxin n=1 Tax=Halobacterium hubeiense TaxID=1407499 RepID=A0A0U5AKG9_9EURY|nr:thioredoxin [Halobacterium hubeiense]CQH64662.1 thioredoxin [Halobacterium hubeiense]
MAEDIEKIRRQKLAELRNKAETGGAEPSLSKSPSEPIHIDGGAELSETAAEYGLVLADFYADWCGPCQMLEPIVETIAAETDATVAKIDIDANQQLAAEYGVRGVPTLILFADGQPAERLVGMQDEAQLRSVIEAHA